MTQIFVALWAWLQSLSLLEVAGTSTGLVCVWLYGRNNIWAWPTGIANALLFAVMFFEAKLYSDVVLQMVFLVLSVHGWYQWLRGGPQQSERPIVAGLHLYKAALLGLVTLAVAAGAGTYFATATDAALPYWDAAILALSLSAQWLLNKKQLENWCLWMLVDVLAVGVYAYRELYLTALLYAVFFGLALNGFVAWRRALQAVPTHRHAIAA